MLNILFTKCSAKCKQNGDMGLESIYVISLTFYLMKHKSNLLLTFCVHFVKCTKTKLLQSQNLENKFFYKRCFFCLFCLTLNLKPIFVKKVIVVLLFYAIKCSLFFIYKKQISTKRFLLGTNFDNLELILSLSYKFCT